MTIQEAKDVCIPFGKYKFYRLGTILDTDPGYFEFLTKMKGLYGDAKEAIATLAADAEVKGKMEHLRRRRVIKRENERRLNAWAWR